MFDEALAIVLKHEGGFVDDPADPGGRTIYGISERAHPEAWADGPPTKADAAAIYRRDYWNRCGCDRLPPAVALIVFDAAVNQGAVWAAKALQRVVGVKTDGIVGPITAKAASANVGRVVAHFSAARLMRYSSLPTFGRFGRGWAIRLADVTAKAAALA